LLLYVLTCSRLRTQLYADNEPPQVRRASCCVPGFLRYYIFPCPSLAGVPFTFVRPSILTPGSGIEVLRLPPDLPVILLLPLLQQRSKDLVPVAVIREESNLYKPASSLAPTAASTSTSPGTPGAAPVAIAPASGVAVFSSLRHGVRAVNRSSLAAFSLAQDGLSLKGAYCHQPLNLVVLCRLPSPSLFPRRPVTSSVPLVTISPFREGLPVRDHRPHRSSSPPSLANILFVGPI
jgi:hypothetical protein